MPHAPLPPSLDHPPEPQGWGGRRYRRTLLDRMGPDAGLLIRCASYGLYVFAVSCIGAIVAGGMGRTGPRVVALIVLGGALAGLAVSTVTWYLARAAGAGFKAFIQPSGGSTPYAPQFSFEESLAARGDVAGALEAYERRMASEPGDVEVRVRAAELYAAKGGKPERAAAILRELRDIPGVPRERVRYATHRLVDLYRGPLDDQGRALVELRRLAETFPGTRDARHAREAIRKLKG